MEKKKDTFIEVTADGKQEIEEGKEPLNKEPGKKYPVAAAQSNYQDAQNEEKRKKEDMKKDKLKGGLADNSKPSDVNPKQLKMGIKVEMEHTKDKKVAMEIAMDHLKEFPDYYSRLDNMEDKAKKDMSKSMFDRWELLKGKLKHEDAFMDIDIDGEEEKAQEEESEEGNSGGIPEEEIAQLLNMGGSEEMQDEDGDGVLEGSEEGEPQINPEDQEEGGQDIEADTATESEEDIPEDVIEEAGGEEEIEKLSPEEIEKMMLEMGYSEAEISHVIHGHTVHYDPEEEMKREAHEHDMEIKRNEAEMNNVKAGADADHAKNTNVLDLKRVGQLHDIEIEHERRMKELDYTMARQARELELKYKEKELEQKLKHTDKDAKVKRDQKKEQHKSKVAEGKPTDNAEK